MTRKQAAKKKKPAKKPARKVKAKAKASGTGRRGTVMTIPLPPNLVPGEGVGSGLYVRSLIMLGKGTDEILALVHKHIAGAETTAQNVSWYRGQLRKAGEKVSSC